MVLTSKPTPCIPQLIVGLGNPGSKYERTRHNTGFAAIDAAAIAWKIALKEQRQFQGWYGDGLGLHGHKLRLLKPSTYMNGSGQALRAVTDWFKLPPREVLVIYDDMDLPLGRIRLRLSGSAGSHNGMKSAIDHLGTQDFPRLRIGIGCPRTRDVDQTPTGYVLGHFSPRETTILERVLKGVVAAVEACLDQGVEQAMNRYNSVTFLDDSDFSQQVRANWQK